jgi:antitoxin YefM
LTALLKLVACNVYRMTYNSFMRSISFSEARNSLKDVLDAVVEDHEVTLIKRRDAEDAVVMSLSDYNALQETMHLLSTPANARHIMKSVAQLRAGKSKRRRLVE